MRNTEQNGTVKRYLNRDILECKCQIVREMEQMHYNLNRDMDAFSILDFIQEKDCHKQPFLWLARDILFF